jgi:hypothetical protein
MLTERDARQWARLYDPEQRRAAEILGSRHPAWLVMYGSYSRLFCAWSRFATIDGQPILIASRDPRELGEQMMPASRSPQAMGAAAQRHLASTGPPEPPAALRGPQGAAHRAGPATRLQHRPFSSITGRSPDVPHATAPEQDPRQVPNSLPKCQTRRPVTDGYPFLHKPIRFCGSFSPLQFAEVCSTPTM